MPETQGWMGLKGLGGVGQKAWEGESGSTPRRTEIARFLPCRLDGEGTAGGEAAALSQWQWWRWWLGRELQDPGLTCQPRHPRLQPLVCAGWEGQARSASPLCGFPPAQDTSPTCFLVLLLLSLPEELGRGPQCRVMFSHHHLMGAQGLLWSKGAHCGVSRCEVWV